MMTLKRRRSRFLSIVCQTMQSDQSERVEVRRRACDPAPLVSVLILTIQQRLIPWIVIL
jgi:hypothetical protein